MGKSYEIDMCHGPLFCKILRFVIPLILSGMLQLLFNAADVIVVGRYAGSHALAAVGATTPLINLLINLFMGISVGANVMVARQYGSGNEKEIYETVHTAIGAAVICGLGMMVLGSLAAKPVLAFMETPEEVLNDSTLYMRIYFIGMPALVIYNFGAAILTAVGDTRRPLYFLTLAGIINIIFNLIFVISFGMGVAGVALATAVSQMVSAALVVLCLCRSKGPFRIKLREIRIYGDKMKYMVRIGLPAGLQGAMFSISNILAQSTINSFGPAAIAGNTAANNIDSFINVMGNSVCQTVISFMSQNLGGKKYKRMNRVIFECLGLILVMDCIMGLGIYFMAKPLLHIYSGDPEVIRFGMVRMSFIAAPFVICGVMDVMAGSVRGMGYSFLPAVVSLTGICLFRVIWIFTVCREHHTMEALYFSYPLSWFLTGAAHTVCCFVVKGRVTGRKEKKYEKIL